MHINHLFFRTLINKLAEKKVLTYSLSHGQHECRTKNASWDYHLFECVSGAGGDDSLDN